MPVSISQYLRVEPELFTQIGALDAILDVDSKFFIDPHLLKSTQAPELYRSYAKVDKRFRDVLHLLAGVKQLNDLDLFWRAAERKFTFPEVKGLCIGYSSKGTSGRGMGAVLRQKILETAKQIVDAGIEDPEIFELIGLFEEKVGADLISDMVGRIIYGDLLQYSSRIFAGFTIEKTKVDYEDCSYEVPINPFNGFPIILLPKDILLDLPIALNCGDIDAVCDVNEKLRQRVNAIIGDAWEEATRISKRDLKRLLLEEPEVLRRLIEKYKNMPTVRYDFENDPAGEIIWHSASVRYVKDFPLELSLPNLPAPEDVLQTVITICNKFKDLIENNGLSELLYIEADKPKKESAAQKLLYGIADAYCEVNKLDVSPETNAGRGSVDFKISAGYASRVVVETKLTTNQRLLHGFDTQITEYQKAEKTTFGVYVVIDVVGGSQKRIEELKKLIRDYQLLNRRIPEVIFVDAKPKDSASVYKPSS
jgi:hypothetical protein